MDLEFIDSGLVLLCWTFTIVFIESIYTFRRLALSLGKRKWYLTLWDLLDIDIPYHYELVVL